MDSLQFYNELSALISQNKIRNLRVSHEINLVIINASYFNFNTINHLVGFFVGVFIMTINSATLTLGILLSVVFAYNLFKDADAINKVSIDFSEKKILLHPLHYFGKLEIQFPEFSKFDTSESGQVDFYSRTRLKCNLKAGERITLFDFPEGSCSSDFLHLFNSLLRIK